MNLLSLFEKDYNRIIETVIKADDVRYLKQEVDEYVITNEIKHKIADFFESYNVDRKSVRANGVWISGFYGSGKSHLLKMLSYILENKENVGEEFANKITDDAKLKADILRAIRKYNAESVLFNIDQQAHITSKVESNAILQVFYKVFYDHLGYYGFSPHVSQFEYILDKEGNYELFKKYFKEHLGNDWTERRQDFISPKVDKAIAYACAKIYGNDPEYYELYLDRIEDKVNQSIEHFAQLVKEYLDSKGADAQLNFFVDEVGQFVAENKSLMLNLQTIAESLLTICEGRSWLFVTAQETLEHLVSDEQALQKDDYSKIQGRFKIKIPLTSANIDEVIERRLLAKKEDGHGEEWLKGIYQREKHNLKTILSITGKGKHHDNFYTSPLDFSNKYPFVPYQFSLFQECLKKLSEHNVFQGRNQSVGERSMLGVFQTVLKGMPTNQKDSISLVSFDLMFDGLRGTLRSDAQGAIVLAEKLLQGNTLAIRIMKLLFLLKYSADDITLTAENISILLINSYPLDLNKHKKEVQKALDVLEFGVYIQRTGDVYEYLTNEEKDIEKEIKNERVDNREINQLLNELIYDHILKGSKINLSDYNRDFYFRRMINGDEFGSEYELKIDFSNQNNESYFSSGTVGTSIMRVKLPESDRLTHEMRSFLQTKSFFMKEQGKSMKETRRDILNKKMKYNHTRHERLKGLVERLVADADYYINGTIHNKSQSADAKIVISEAFKQLVETVYTKMSLVSDFDFSEKRLKSILGPDQQSSFLGSIDTNSNFKQATQEIHTFLIRQEKTSKRVNLADLKDYFGCRPYGWEVMDVWCLLAMLSKLGKIEAKRVTNTLNDSEFLDCLLNNRTYQEIRITLQEEFDLELLNAFKRFHFELFNETNSATEAKEIVRLFQHKARALVDELRGFLNKRKEYPFYSELSELEKTTSNLLQLEYADLLKQHQKFSDALLDDKELFDEFKQFDNSPQKEVYNNIKDLLEKGEVNLSYIQNDKIEQLKKMMSDSSSRVLSQLHKASDWIREIEAQIIEELGKEVKKRLEQWDAIIADVQNDKDYLNLPKAEQERVLEEFKRLKEDIKKCKYIGRLKEYEKKLDDLHIEQLNYINERYAYYIRIEEQKKEQERESSSSKAVVSTSSSSLKLDHVTEPVAVYSSKTYISLANIMSSLSFESQRIENQDDVNAYVNKVKQALEEEIKNNRVIFLK